MHIWICWDIVAGVLDGKWTMSDSCGMPWFKASPLTTLNTWSAVIQFFWSSLKKVSLSGNEVTQQGPCRDRHAILLLQEWWMLHEPCLTAVVHVISHGFTSNHTQDMLRCHAGFLIKLEKYISSRRVSDPMRSMQVWIWYPTVAGVSDVTSIMSDSCGACHESQLHLQLHERYAQL